MLFFMRAALPLFYFIRDDLQLYFTGLRNDLGLPSPPIVDSF
jgi:hypothetical protein